MKILAAVFALLLLVTLAGVAGQNVNQERPSSLPQTPASVKSILLAQRFTLETPYINTWSKERPRVLTGVLIVVEVDPAYVFPRNTLEPVLYAGNLTVQRLNQGYQSGRVIGLVPGNIDLTRAPIWFGAPQLPERVTESMVQAERARAERVGVRPLPSALLSTTERPAVTAKDLADLLRTVAADLVYQYSPQEKELADSWRLPEAKATPRRSN
jgi:hypothetical protein